MTPPRTLTALALLWSLALAVQEPTVRGKTLDDWRTAIEPCASELAYAEIPWRPSFWSAVVEAQQQERPILLWAMNGHPLGCT